MEKILKVCRASYNGKQSNAINLKGEYLKKYDFQEDDFVKVTISKGIILIEKAKQNDIIKAFNAKNPALLKLIENLELIPA